MADTEEYIRRDGSRFTARAGYAARLASRPTLRDWEAAGQALLRNYGKDEDIYKQDESVAVLIVLARRVESIEAEIAEHRMGKS